MKSIIEKKKKLLRAVLGILIVAIVTLGYVDYKAYKMSQMDKYMIQANKVADKEDQLIDEANAYADEDNIDMTAAKVDAAIEKEKEVISLGEKAYQYADGPYKEVIGLLLERDQLLLQGWELWRNRLECIKEGDYASAWGLYDQEKDISTEIDKIEARKEAIKSKNPEVKEHIERVGVP